MLKELLKNTKFRSEIRFFFKKNEDKVVDIILFGSVTKGKEKPQDIDILVIYKKNIDLTFSHNLAKLLEKILGIPVSISSKTYKDLFNPSFIVREAVLSEGYSLVNNVFISEGLGYFNMALFRYSLKGRSKSERMRFYYSLYGRGGEKGILHKLNAYKFSNEVIISPVGSVEEMRIYLKRWSISYLETPLLIPARIVQSKAFVPA